MVLISFSFDIARGYSSQLSFAEPNHAVVTSNFVLLGPHLPEQQRGFN